jgi:radical SAM protein with 4Fe4S-binding SPASM domain
MSGAELGPVWQQLVALRPRKVVFTGGEPLLRPDLLDLLRSLRAADPDHRVLRCLNTNGHLVTPQLAQELVGLADEVRVSVDALPERNDALRGPGTFAAALNALECFHRLGFEPKALVTVTSHSLPDLEDLLCLLLQRGIAQVNLNALRLIGRARRNSAWQVDPAEVHAAVERAWARCYPQRPQPPPTPAPTAHPNCGVGQLLNITPNGDVFPCHVLARREFCCGNLREESLLAICRRNGPLGRLAALDLGELMRQDPSLAIARCDACLGDVYAATRSSPTWVEILPRPRAVRAPVPR